VDYGMLSSISTAVSSWYR